MKQTQFIGIVGHKKSGKTTLVEHLAKEMTTRGLLIGTIKLTTHDLEFDSPGKDTYRHRIAGSKLTLIKSKKQVALFSDLIYFNDEQIKLIFQKCDFVFIEGDSGSKNPKIYVVDEREARTDIAGEIIATWGIQRNQSAIPRFDKEQIKELSDFIINKYKTGGEHGYRSKI
jgi:molybdopterin-guanine dinucleotide biosynthesis adapter protein